MKKLSLALSSIALILSGSYAFAGDAAAGKKIASIRCGSCHGANGISQSEQWPNLAGQKEKYLVKQIKDFRDKKRVDPVMSAMAASLTDADAENIAAYYSSLKP